MIRGQEQRCLVGVRAMRRCDTYVGTLCVYTAAAFRLTWFCLARAGKECSALSSWLSFLRIAVIPLGLLSLSDTALAQDRVTLSAGAEYTNGDYGGTEDIAEWYAPLTVRYKRGTWAYRVTVPYLRVATPTDGELIGFDADGRPIYSGGTDTTTESGIGDVIASVSYYGIYKNLERGILVDVTGKIKFGTADADKGLGTGENDYTVGVDMIKRNRPYTSLIGLGYTIRGDLPDQDLRNTYAFYGGVLRDFTDKLDAGLFFAYSRSVLAGQDALRELDFDLSYRLTPAISLRTYVIRGLSDSSPDLGVGFTVGYSMDIHERTPRLTNQ